MRPPAYKYQRIAHSLSERLETGDLQGRDRLPAEAALAEEYGVTHLTVRRALDVLQEDGRIVRRRGRGTFVVDPAAAARRGRLLYIGDTEAHFYRSLYLAHTRQAQIREERLSAFSPALEESPERLARRLQGALDGCEGMIVQDAYADLVRRALGNREANVVVAGLHPPLDPTWPVRYVLADDFQVFSLATRCLAERGHSHIGFVSGPDELQPGAPFGRPSPTRTTHQGYRAGLTFCEEARETTVGACGDSMEEWTVSLQSWLADLSAWPTAFVCEGDFRAVALLRAAAACGRRAPEDFSCVGAGNTPYCEMTNPALTSVSYNEAAMASLAMLFSRQAPPPAPEVYRVAPDLIERNSVTPGSGRSVVATAPFGKGDPT